MVGGNESAAKVVRLGFRRSRFLCKEIVITDLKGLDGSLEPVFGLELELLDFVGQSARLAVDISRFSERDVDTDGDVCAALQARIGCRWLAQVDAHKTQEDLDQVAFGFGKIELGSNLDALERDVRVRSLCAAFDR